VHIAAVGWIYVTLMMAITEETVIAGIMTFFLYGVLPTLIIVYLGGSPQRRRRNEEARLRMMQERQNSAAQEPKQDADGVK
jgi:biotin transporter BioY